MKKSNKGFYMVAFATILLMGCKAKEHYQLEEIKSSYKLNFDSAYIDSISTHLISFSSTVIKFDSTGKPTTATINKAVREAKTELKKGNLNKAVEAVTESKKENKKIDRDTSELFKINWFGLCSALLLIVVILYIYNKK